MLTRRSFVKTSALAASAAALVPSVIEATSAYKPIVAVAKGEPADCVKRVIAALGGIKNFVKPGSRVVIKPNMGFPNPPEWSTTTHPEVVKAVAELCIEAGARRVIVIDHPLRDGEMCKERTGIGAALASLKGVVIAMPDDEKFFEEKTVPGAKELKTTLVAKEVLKADCLINIPTAKSHSATGVSLGIKNLMGLVWDRKVFHERLELNRAVAEQLLVIKPNLTIVDAVYALLTNGPGGPGNVTKIDTIVASADPVAADSYSVGLARWYNREFKGEQVKHIKIAAEMGFGEIDIAKMDIKTV
ncbi:MAG: DUF362 domain-containing protein [Fibrobacteres bacterium]|nr:DUF362 domain-containing protein [Fibrobacterota bacterium]